MARKRVFLAVLAVTVLCSVCGYFLYNYFYKIDIIPYNYVFLARYSESPDEQNAISLIIYKMEESSDTTYVMGTLTPLIGRDARRDSRIIFWQKVDTESLEEKVIDGQVLTDWIDLEWIDNNTAEINGITVNLDKGYDYRRN